MAFSEVIHNQQIEINIELVCVTVNFGNFYSELVKNFHYCRNLKVLISNDPESPGLCLLHTNTDDAILWCSPSGKGEATAMPEIQSIVRLKGKRKF